jgi:hypothetical protein
MNKDQLAKRLNGYIKAFVVSILALYAIGQAREQIIESGGTDHLTASIFVTLNALIAFITIFCLVMMFRLKSQIKRGDAVVPKEPLSFARLVQIAKTPAILVGAIGVLVLAGLFYWYEWRPAQILKECAKSYIPGGVGRLSEESYLRCLRSHGLDQS